MNLRRAALQVLETDYLVDRVMYLEDLLRRIYNEEDFGNIDLALVEEMQQTLDRVFRFGYLGLSDQSQGD